MSNMKPGDCVDGSVPAGHVGVCGKQPDGNWRCNPAGGCDRTAECPLGSLEGLMASARDHRWMSNETTDKVSYQVDRCLDCRCLRRLCTVGCSGTPNMAAPMAFYQLSTLLDGCPERQSLEEDLAVVFPAVDPDTLLVVQGGFGDAVAAATAADLSVTMGAKVKSGDLPVSVGGRRISVDVVCRECRRTPFTGDGVTHQTGSEESGPVCLWVGCNHQVQGAEPRCLGCEPFDATQAERYEEPF